MVGVRLLPLPQHLIHLSSQFAAPKPNLPILGSYKYCYKKTFAAYRKRRRAIFAHYFIPSARDVDQATWPARRL
jgi:hypothetical protein